MSSKVIPVGKMQFHDNVLSVEDFEQLPAAFRRKYFSSLERLRLAHDGTSPARSKSKSWSQPLKRPSTSHNFPVVSGISNSSPSRSFSSSRRPSRNYSVPGASKPRARLQRHSRQATTTSPATLFINPWEFAALPPAIRRKHFSTEEQYYIVGQLNPVILDAADEALYKQYQQYRVRQVSTAAKPFDYNHDYDPDLGFASDQEEWEDMDVRDLETFSWLDNDNDLDLRLDDYHAINSDLSGKQQTCTHRRSFRRGLSFSNVSFRRRSSSSTSLQSPPPVGSNINKVSPPQTSATFVPGHRSRDSTASLDASTTHYQDPAAKMKLRVYLASPQKFDEALEFGFPSLHQEAVQSPNRPKTSPGIVNGRPKTFFSDDTPSLSEDESRDERSEYLYQDSPRTPIEMSFPAGRSSYKSSTEGSSSFRPRIIRDTGDNYTSASAADREMTLRMTLTRPELRAIEDSDHQQKSANVNERPLERAPLTAPVNLTGSIWDELPEEPSRVKRFLKKLKGRS